MFLAGATLGGRTGNNFYQINEGETPSQLMERTGFGDIEVQLVQTVGRPLLKSGEEVEVVSEKNDTYLVNVPWNETGVENLSRPVAWWNPIQNIDYAKALDPLAETYQLVSFYHAGKNGEWIIWQFQMPDFYVDRDPNGGHSAILTIAENRSAGKYWFGNVITRLFCTNQFGNKANSMREMVSGSLGHMFLDVRVFLEQQRIQHLHQLNDLFLKPATRKDVDNVANALFPVPKKSNKVVRLETAVGMGYENELADKYIHDNIRDLSAAERRYIRHTSEFRQRVEKNFDELGDNFYGLWQAATEHISHTELFQSDEDVRQMNQLFGKDAVSLERAWAVVTK